MRIFRSGLRKLVRRLATWLTFGLLAGLLVLIMIAVGATASRAGGSAAQRAATLTLVTFPTAYDAILTFLLGLGGLFAVIYGASVAGSEWTWGTLKNAVARGESRSRYTLLSFASVALVIAVGLVVAFVIGVVAGIVGANLAGVSTAGLNDAATLGRLPEQFVRGGLAIIEEGALGFAIATVARSQLAGIGAGIALYFGETFARLFLPDIVKYLPFDVATAAVSTGARGGFGGGGGQQFPTLDANTAMVLVGVWLVGSLLVAAAVTERAEISG
jgi:ABC-2 type transport system permease protein